MVDGRFDLHLKRCLRVDFLGPPGVGKTTLIRTTFEGLHSYYRNCNLPVCDVSLATKFAIRQFELAQCSRFRRTLLRPLSQVLRQLFSARRFRIERSPREQTQFVRDFLRTYHTVVDALVREWFDPWGCQEPLAVRYHDFITWIEPWILSSVYGPQMVVLADNSRFTKGVAWLLHDHRLVEMAGGIDAIKACFDSAAGPSAVVLLTADPNEVFSRAMKRAAHGSLHPAHRSRSEREILEYTTIWNEVNCRAVQIFEEWGMATLRLNAELPPENNAKALIEFAGSLYASKMKTL